MKEEYYKDYREFMEDPEPLKLLGELGALRTALVEYQQSRTVSHTIKMQVLARKAAECIENRAIDQDGEISVDDMYSIISAHMVRDTQRMTGEDVKSIAHLVDTISKVAERAKRIEEGITLKLAWDNDLVQIIINFVTLVVLRFVPSPLRPALAAATRDYLQGKGQAAECLALGSTFQRGQEVIDHEG